MTANGNYQGFYGCSFIGWQDTLYAKAGQQYYKRCYIEGRSILSWLVSPTNAFQRWG